MAKSSSRRDNFYLLSLGCSKNAVDSESMGQILSRQGMHAVGDPSRLLNNVKHVDKVLSARRKLPKYLKGLLSIGPILIVLAGALIVADLVALSYFCGWNRARTVGYVGLWALFGRSGSNTPPPPAETWVRPQSGEHAITLVPKGAAVKVTVIQLSNGETLYDGTIPQGDTREIARRGKIQIRTNTPEKLNIRIGNSEHSLRQSSGAYLQATDIVAP